MAPLKLLIKVLAFVALTCCLSGCASSNLHRVHSFENYTLDYNTPVDPGLQSKLQTLDEELRGQFGMTPEQTAAGVLDLRTLRLAMVRPDRIEYAASVPKLGILLAYFQAHPEGPPDEKTRHELGLMAKASSNEMASRFSHELGLKQVQEVLNSYGFYDAARGGGIWVGKHYGESGERYGDPLGDNSHAATVRQLLRFYLLLEQRKLVSPSASDAMRQVLASPEIPHDPIKFVKGLAGRERQVIRKWGTWEDWFHDTAVVTGPGRHYIIVGLTRHPRGDEYLERLVQAVDEWMAIPGN